MSKALFGYRFCLSGKFHVKQSELHALLEEHGGDVKLSMNASVTHLISDDMRPSSKLKAAKTMKVPVVNMDFIREAIENGGLEGLPIPANSPPSKSVAKGGGKKRGVKRKREKSGGEEDDVTVDKSEPRNVKRRGTFHKAVGARAAVDSFLQEDIRLKCKVLEEGETVWDCMLNQTNIKNNNNKFYLIQLLVLYKNKKLDAVEGFRVWMRWGRVGGKGGQHREKLLVCDSVDKAKSFFTKKFCDKTGNAWEARDSFEQKKGKYTMIHLDYGDDDVDESFKVNEDRPAESHCTLPKQLQALVKLVFNRRMMEHNMLEIGYDAEKLPLGKLSEKTLKQGYQVLKLISSVINKESEGDVRELSSQFYTYIPHDFGHFNIRASAINTPGKLKKKLEMLEALKQITIAAEMYQTIYHIDPSLDIITARYSSLNCGLVPIPRSSPTFETISHYARITHGSTHNHWSKIEIEDVFAMDRQGEQGSFRSDVGNVQLLWHGSRLSNYIGILSQGLRIAPPEAPVTGYMFGKGIYFADCVSKSAQYCFPTESNDTGIILLCEVALGSYQDKYDADCEAGTKMPAMKHSTRGCGKWVPDPSTFRSLESPAGKSVTVPSGKLVNADKTHGSLMYNEYVVYDVNQVRCAYLLKVKFHFSEDSDDDL